jgi:formate hydrogenlyase subunit 4
VIEAAVGQVVVCLTVLLMSPLLKGTIDNLKAKLRSRRGPSPLQPRYDLAKLFRKEHTVTPSASWVFRVAPFVAFAAPVAFAVLIPVLAAFPVSWVFMADMVGSGFVIGGRRLHRQPGRHGWRWRPPGP